MIEFGEPLRYGKSFCEIEPGTAMLVAGGLGAGGSIFSGIMGASGASKQADAIRYAAEVARQTALELDAKARADLDPFRSIGVRAGQTLESLMYGGGGVSEYLKPSELYKFQSEIGSRDINRQLAARGLYGSGAGLETLARFTNQLVADEGERYYNRLAGLTTLGANAAARQATGSIQTGTNLSQILANAGAQQGQAYAAQYNALGQGIGGAFGQAGSLLANYPILQQNLATQQLIGQYFGGRTAATSGVDDAAGLGSLLNIRGYGGQPSLISTATFDQ
jgi:hypothetical protein